MERAPKRRVEHPVFCLRCGSNCCEHLQRSRGFLLSPREVELLRTLCNPAYDGHAEMAHAMGLALGTFKVYVSHIYEKLEWKTGNALRLILWAMAYRKELGIQLPDKESFGAALKGKR
jgi:DNA-binding CsgD family transcriptional regulator